MTNQSHESGRTPSNGSRGSTEPLKGLAEQAVALAQQVDKLNQDVGDQIVKLVKIAKLNRKMIIGLIISVSLDILLTISMAFGLTVLNNNSNHIQSITNRLNIAQTVDRQKALCPLYQLFLDAKSAQARATYPQGTAAYDHVFAIIQGGYNALQCTIYIDHTKNASKVVK